MLLLSSIQRLPLLFCLVTLITLGVSPATPAGVVISELMYHPPSVEEAEFVELFNSGSTTIDLQNWCFEGIELCLPAGATMEPGEYLVLARDPSQFHAVYNFNPDFVYLAELDNSGERIALLDATGGLTVPTSGPASTGSRTSGRS